MEARPAAILLLLSLLGSGCSILSGPDARAELRARVEAADLVLENRGESPIFYFAVDHEVTALISWAPCTNPVACPRVPPRSEIRVPLDSIGSEDSPPSTVAIYWWYLVPDFGGGWEPDRIRVVVVEI